MEEYSVEWFKWQYQNNTKWLGTQAVKLLEHYIKLEAENERLEEIDGAARLFYATLCEAPEEDKAVADWLCRHQEALRILIKALGGE